MKIRATVWVLVISLAVSSLVAAGKERVLGEGVGDARPVSIAKLLADPEAAFGRVLRKIGAPIDRDVLAMATKFASFDVLAAQEAAEGFREKGTAQTRFFRTGSAGQWRDTLPEDIVQRIVADHGEVMKRHGYLDP